MTARLRLVPIYGGDAGRHYMVLDRLSPDTDMAQISAMVDRIQKVAPEAIPVVTSFSVYIPQEDGEDPDAAKPLDDNASFADLAAEASGDSSAGTTPSTFTTTLSVGRQVLETLRQHRAVS